MAILFSIGLPEVLCSAEQTGDLVAVSKSDLDILWILIAASLVFLMQAGFMCIESGLTRAKNSINVAIKNMADFVLAVISFWMIGFGLMFGASYSGLFGTSLFFISVEEDFRLASLLLFQAVFCGTAATIVSGAIAERARFSAYLVVSVITSALIYPISGHWVWGDLLGSGSGWLQSLGFIDFAGSTVVHAVGAGVALAALIIVGPRIGKFEGDQIREIAPHSLLLTFLGTFILFFGWFGFNCGSTMEVTPEVATIAWHTMIAACFSAVACGATSWRFDGRLKPEMLANGMLGGLVSITAGCHVVSSSGAAVIGLLAGVTVYASCKFIERVLRLDDVASAVSVHGSCGILGTIAVGFCIGSENLPLGMTRSSLILVQTLGALSCTAWGFLVAFAALLLVKRFVPVRVSEEDERVGLNVAEHGATSSILDLADSMHRVTTESDYSETSKVEPEYGTEIGDLATSFNSMLDAIHQQQEAISVAWEREKSQSQQLQRKVSELNEAQKRIADEKAKLQVVLNGTGEGVFAVDLDGNILPQKSDIVTDWFGPLVPETKFWDYLAGNDADLSDELWLGFSQLADAVLPFELAADQAACQFTRNSRTYQVAYRELSENGSFSGVLIIVSDVTLQIEMERTQQQVKEFHQVVSNLMKDESGFRQFIDECTSLLQQIRETDDQEIANRLIHTVKGNSAIMGFDSISNELHQLESTLIEHDRLPDDQELDDIESTWMHSLEKIEQFLTQDGENALKIEGNDVKKVEQLLHEQADHTDILNLIQTWYYEPTACPLRRLTEQAKRLADQLGKPIQVAIDDGGLRIPPEWLQTFWPTMIHVIRNAVDHGFESELERSENGKPNSNQLTLATRIRDNWLEVTIQDDGRGIDWERVRDKAKQVGMATKTDSDLVIALFSDGLSTKDDVTELSGRGVGLSSVKHACEEAGGSISVSSEQGKGTTTTFRFPLNETTRFHQRDVADLASQGISVV